MSFKADTPLITKLSKFTNLTKFTIFRYLGHSYTTTKQTTKKSRLLCIRRDTRIRTLDLNKSKVAGIH